MSASAIPHAVDPSALEPVPQPIRKKGRAMSFEVFLCSYRDGEPAGIEEGPLRGAFGDAIRRAEPGFSCWRLEYGSEANGCDVYVTRTEGDPTRVKALLVSRPVADGRLWASLFRVMRLGHVVLFSPGLPSPLFADAQSVRHASRDLLDALAEPVIVGSGAEILSAVEAA
jgi:hypothetical protein